jgi:NAD-dependent deacetylase
MVERCQPNPAHYALAQLDDLIPHCVVITQNIDGFHAMAGSSDVIELHGNIKRYKCSRDCQGNPTIIPVNAYQVDQIPLCPHCEALLRPDITWFGENLPQMALYRAIDLAQNADVIIVIGTSGMVNPAAAIPGIVKQNGGMVIDVNPQGDNLQNVVDIFLQAPAGEVLPALVEVVRELV